MINTNLKELLYQTDLSIDILEYQNQLYQKYTEILNAIKMSLDLFTTTEEIIKLLYKLMNFHINTHYKGVRLFSDPLRCFTMGTTHELQMTIQDNYTTISGIGNLLLPNLSSACYHKHFYFNENANTFNQISEIEFLYLYPDAKTNMNAYTKPVHYTSYHNTEIPEVFQWNVCNPDNGILNVKSFLNGIEYFDPKMFYAMYCSVITNNELKSKFFNFFKNDCNTILNFTKHNHQIILNNLSIVTNIRNITNDLLTKIEYSIDEEARGTDHTLNYPRSLL
jgi:hypothetical protein